VTAKHYLQILEDVELPTYLESVGIITQFANSLNDYATFVVKGHGFFQLDDKN
jgi:hypothetical protein